MTSFIPNSELDSIDESLIGVDLSVRQENSINTVENVISTSELWIEGSIDLETRPYNEITGLKVPIPDSEIGFFKLLMTDYIFKYLVKESNKYAHSSMNEQDKLEFKLINITEMKKFISLIIYMGICKLPTYEMYWKKKDNSFFQNFPKNILAFDRFCEIKKYFHVFDNANFLNLSQSNQVATKLDGLIGYFNKKFSEVYIPERELAIDENLCS